MKELKISAIKEGTVIDHVPSPRVFKVAKLLNLEDTNNIVSVAANLRSGDLGRKGIIKIGGRRLTREETDKIALIAPDATVNIIEDYDVTKKEKVSIPDEVTNLVKCSNPMCITNNEEIESRFKVLSKEPLKLKCGYCERNTDRESLKLL